MSIPKQIPLPTVLKLSVRRLGSKSSRNPWKRVSVYVVSARHRLEDGEERTKGARLLDFESKRVSVKDEELNGSCPRRVEELDGWTQDKPPLACFPTVK